MDAILTIVNASFDKIAFLGGLVLELVTVFCNKPVRLGGIRLPGIDRSGRILAGLIGTLLVGWAIFVWTASSTIGLISVRPEPESEVLQQDQPKRVRLSSGEDIGVLVHSIKSRGTSKIVLFKVDTTTQGVLNREIPYNYLVNRIGRNRIIWEESIIQGGAYRFLYQNHTYNVRVNKVYWYAVGPDYVVVSIE